MFINKLLDFTGQILSLFENYFIRVQAIPKKSALLKQISKVVGLSSNATTQFLKQTYSSATSHIAILFLFFYLRKEHSKNLKKPPKHQPKNTAQLSPKNKTTTKKTHNQKTKPKQPTQDYKKPSNIF